MLVEEGFEKAGVDPMARPETLTLEQFVALSDQMVA
jgi:16S rRNA (adenine1518-N6/adenine1519-N6)-dimethyltransferase